MGVRTEWKDGVKEKIDRNIQKDEKKKT